MENKDTKTKLESGNKWKDSLKASQRYEVLFDEEMYPEFNSSNEIRTYFKERED